MAGSYQHCINDDGTLRDVQDLAASLENGGDVYEAVEEMYGMIWHLAGGNAAQVAHAQKNYKFGMKMAPGNQVAKY